MNLTEAVVEVRDAIRNGLPAGVVTGNWGDDKLKRYIAKAEKQAFYLELDIDRTRFRKQATITVTVAQELQTLPTDYIKFGELKLAADTGVAYLPYTFISYDMRDNYLMHTPSGRACYEFSPTQIGILPKPAVGDAFTLTYLRRYTPMAVPVVGPPAVTGASDLHELTLDVVILKAALMALADRGDVNTNSTGSLLAEAINMLPKMKRHSRAPHALEPYGLGNPFEQPFMFT